MAIAILRTPQEWFLRYTSAGKFSALSVGAFDGLHLGHQEVLRGVVARARAAESVAGVVTFDPHPLRILRPAEAPPMIATLEQRLAGFERAGIEAALVLAFTPAVAEISARDFLEAILVERLGMGAICVGPNFRFGHKQTGNTDLLSEMGPELGYEVEIVPPALLRGEIVSSTAVRTAVAAGQVSAAAELLGRPFSLTGPIRSGAGRGGAILVPTLNLAPEQELLPKTGVYCTETVVGGKVYRSATNVGYRPTFDGQALSVESHLFDFSEMTVSETIEVRFWERLRDEQKFTSVDELRRQIELDLRAAREFFRKRDASIEHA
ncbi:MAG: bifunctional riboflavin kinase/FAD synthetase [Candidatus Acidiferrales bacterium]